MLLQIVQESSVQKRQNHLDISGTLSLCIEINLMNNPQVIPMRKRIVFATAIVFAVAIMITIPFKGFILASTAVAQQQQITSNSSFSQGNNSSSNPLSLNTIFKQVENSVVQIKSKTSNATTLGSGFVYDKQGNIVTNSHVVGDAKVVDVTFPDGNRYSAKVIASDVYGDIAVLQISHNTSQSQRQLSSLKPLVLGNSSSLEVGDTVIAIGNPFGLSDTMTTGIVGGIERSIPISVGGFLIPNTIQTDAPVDPGNSGGPLLNMQGEVIGMNTAAILSSNTFSGIGFAIPSNTITKIVPILIGKGYYPHPFLGLSVSTLTSDLAQDNGMPVNLKGVYVNTITKNGPADKAGIHGSTIDQYGSKHLGDIIIALDRHNISSSDDLINYIGQHKIAGNNITLTLFRNGHTIDLKATLTVRPSMIPFLTTRSAPPSIPHPPTRPPTIPTPHP
jgi:S1-C subfamily serine protease